MLLDACFESDFCVHVKHRYLTGPLGASSLIEESGLLQLSVVALIPRPSPLVAVETTDLTGKSVQSPNSSFALQVQRFRWP